MHWLLVGSNIPKLDALYLCYFDQYLKKKSVNYSEKVEEVIVTINVQTMALQLCSQE